MAHSSLNDHAFDQKSLSADLPLFDLRDRLFEELRQAAALAAVANSQDFLEFDDALLQDYLWALRNLVISALERYSLMDERLDKLGLF